MELTESIQCKLNPHIFWKIRSSEKFANFLNTIENSNSEVLSSESTNEYIVKNIKTGKQYDLAVLKRLLGSFNLHIYEKWYKQYKNEEYSMDFIIVPGNSKLIKITGTMKVKDAIEGCHIVYNYSLDVYYETLKRQIMYATKNKAKSIANKEFQKITDSVLQYYENCGKIILRCWLKFITKKKCFDTTIYNLLYAEEKSRDSYYCMTDCFLQGEEFFEKRLEIYDNTCKSLNLQCFRIRCIYPLD